MIPKTKTEMSETGLTLSVLSCNLGPSSRLRLNSGNPLVNREEQRETGEGASVTDGPISELLNRFCGGSGRNG
jgi:hypothetical protein